eukprot:5178248-Pleurochrysis_carterae.AAC.2
MVCEDCKSKLSVISAPDPWKDGSRGSSSGSAARKINENKLLKKGIRANPYGNACKICKLKCQQNCAMYCTICAYAKGLCAICGKQVLDTTMYKMSEGGNQWHTVKNRDPKAFKSAEQIAREDAHQQLFEHLESTGQVGRMPTKAALEQSGKKELAETLIKTYGGLNAAADALSLSKRNLIDEQERRKEAKMQAAQQAFERTVSAGVGNAVTLQAGAVSNSGTTDTAAVPSCEQSSGSASAPTGKAAAKSASSTSASAGHACKSSKTSKGTASTVASSASTPASENTGSLDTRWQFDPNSGYHFQLSSGSYYDAKTKMYFKDGAWTATAP